MQGTVTIAQISDVHLGPPRGFSPQYWNAKRLLGWANWLRRRRFVHVPAVAARLIADIQGQQPDHIAVTGDLVNIGLPAEHESALTWLATVGPADKVSVIPGNHDIYCEMAADPGAMRWRPYMSPDRHGTAYAQPGVDFPYVRQVGLVAIIGVNSSVPTPPAVATGQVGADQIGRLARLLARLEVEGYYRLVLIHHPPLPGLAKPSRALKDAAALEAVLTEHGAELVVHGHNHTNTLNWVERTAGRPAVPVVGVASGSAAKAYKDEPLARYNVFCISGRSGAWVTELIGRGLKEPAGPIVEIERRLLAGEVHADRVARMGA